MGWISQHKNIRFKNNVMGQWQGAFQSWNKHKWIMASLKILHLALNFTWGLQFSKNLIPAMDTKVVYILWCMGRWVGIWYSSFFLLLVKQTAENNWSKLATISHYNPTLILEGFEILLCDCQDHIFYILKSAVYNTRPTWVRLCARETIEVSLTQLWQWNASTSGVLAISICSVDVFNWFLEVT